MARDILSWLVNLRTRRSGLDRIGLLTSDSAREVVAASARLETYAARAPRDSHTRYTLGAMQEIAPGCTRISLDQADRISTELAHALFESGIPYAFRLQGAVPANVHIHGVCEIDLLAIDDAFFTYDANGQKARAGAFNSPIAYRPLSALQKLRKVTEHGLQRAFPAAAVDRSGAQAVMISKGPLTRPVEVTPAHWHDTVDFQRSGEEHDRGIFTLKKNAAQRAFSMPFRHILRINQADAATRGGLKKAIRLCKNVGADAARDGAPVTLSSFEIEALVWHADLSALEVAGANELSILAEVQRHLDALTTNQERARRLSVPDGSRPIFDLPEKLESLDALSAEVDELSLAVAKEQVQGLSASMRTHQWARDNLKRALVP
jgi:hypothetical protein